MLRLWVLLPVIANVRWLYIIMDRQTASLVGLFQVTWKSRQIEYLYSFTTSVDLFSFAVEEVVGSECFVVALVMTVAIVKWRKYQAFLYRIIEICE